eukprot:1178640-Prorocentrum_minimum.AAC.2
MQQSIGELSLRQLALNFRYDLLEVLITCVRTCSPSGDPQSTICELAVPEVRYPWERRRTVWEVKRIKGLHRHSTEHSTIKEDQSFCLHL